MYKKTISDFIVCIKDENTWIVRSLIYLVVS